MTKEELVNEISSRTGFTKKDCLLFLDVFCDTIEDSLSKGERVKIVDFGVFDVKVRKSRTGKNFFENTTLPIPSKKIPTFTPGEGLKSIVGGIKDG